MVCTMYPAYLCTGTEKEIDMTEHYRNPPVRTMPPHPPEKQTISANGIYHMPDKKKVEKGEKKFLKILEYFVDSFINIFHPKF